jgi:hypothetical protein
MQEYILCYHLYVISFENLVITDRGWQMDEVMPLIGNCFVEGHFFRCKVLEVCLPVAETCT